MPAQFSAPNWRQWFASKKRLIAVIAGAVIVAAIPIAYFLYPGSRPARFLHLARSRYPDCPLACVWGAIDDFDNRFDRIYGLYDKITALKSEGAIDLVEAPQGRFWIPTRNREILAGMLIDQDDDVYGKGEHSVQAGDTVLDCGANVGVFTRKALSHGARLVVAIEPAPENLICLRKTFEEEIRAGLVIVYPKGVWDHDCELVLRTYDYQSGGDSVALKFPHSQAGPTVQLTTIDELTSELKLQSVDFIKMDIEGAERQALRGAQQTIARFRPRLAISLEHTPTDAEEIPALIWSLWPFLRTERGPCIWVSTEFVSRLQPEVVFAGP
jgi:FkbM family methyltransferase